MSDTIVSIDVETTGLIPGLHSMISLGAVAFVDYQEFDSFYVCLNELSDLERLPSTMGWWQKFPEKYNEIKNNQIPPYDALEMFAIWLSFLPKPLVFAADPITFDLGFITYYCFRLLGQKRYSEIFPRMKGIDIKSVVMATLGGDYSEVKRDNFPKEWSEGLEVTHNALDDARQQGRVLMNCLKLNRGMVIQ